ncbi:unnamed protein product [Lactuca saligna]|uniref:Glutaredoxin domain-containing protein n=1 Tax=Lactuca saligna TaxID=75948 RepID=A0AA35YN77_LACSI|nr:unnamed protein product [Lactuca saligna]
MNNRRIAIFGTCWWGFGVMGCTPSKQTVCRNCNSQCSPVRRSYSSDVHRSSTSTHDGDHRHIVALTSTTLGYLQLDSSKPNQVRHDPVLAQIFQEPVRENLPEKKSKEFAVGVIEAKTWSKMINEKITKTTPTTPIRTPPGEPETINTWELMEGLDDSSPLRPPSTVDLDHIRRFSYIVNSNSIPQEKDRDVEVLCKPLWLQIKEKNHSDSNSNSNNTSIASYLDPNQKPLISERQQSSEGNFLDVVRRSLQDGKTEIMSGQTQKDKLILYFTSLRGVRKTYEDCCHVRVILKSSGARVDERDVSMHSGFKEELKELLGDRFGGGGGLPKVFVGKKYIGGAEEIRQLHDEFQLDKVLEDCEMVDEGGGGGGCGGGGRCEACGDVRFLPCETCSGSCKIYYEVDSDEGEKEEENDYGFQRCPDCNENGLVRAIKLVRAFLFLKICFFSFPRSWDGRMLK